MSEPVVIIFISILFLTMWGWILSVFTENFSIKKKINKLISQSLTIEQKEELDTIQLDLDTNAYRAKRAKRVVLFFVALFVILIGLLIWLNSKYNYFSFDGLLFNIKWMTLIVILVFAPAYIGLELVSNTEGASSDISRLKFTEELKSGEEVEV